MSSATELYFCVFRASGSTAYPFPNFHIPYGVFTYLSTEPLWGTVSALATGTVFTDDEDSSNQDYGCVVNIIYGSDSPPGLFGKNSYLKVAQVRNDPPLPTCNWTQWYDRDSPGGVGDYELRADQVPAVCASPSAVECQTVTGVPASQTREVISCTPSEGFVCVNANQSDGACQDYKVRFCCP